MRALVMTEPGGSEFSTVREVPVPRPGPGELTVDVEYAGLNFMDVMARRGDPGYVPSWPYAPGLEVAGPVRETGPGVTDLPAGTRVAAVTAGGGLAQVATARAALTVPVPGPLPGEVAAAAPLGAATALLLLADVGRFTPGDSVLVHSAGGGIGGLVAGFFPVLGGGRLLGTVGSPRRAAAARERGYDAVFARDGALVDAVRAATGGRGVDLVLDPLGTAALEEDLAMTAPGGRIVLFGNAGGAAPAPLPAAGRLIGGNVTLAGFSHRGLAAAAPDRVAGALRRALDLLAAGGPAPRVTVLGGLDEVAVAHDLLASGHSGGKYVVRL